jgi:hypothetical protein
LTIYQYSSVSKFKSDAFRSQSLDIVYAIDCDTYNSKDKSYNDFHALADCVSANGTAIVSSHYRVEKFKVKKEDDKTSFESISIMEVEKPTSIEDNYKQIRQLKQFYKE